MLMIAFHFTFLLLLIVFAGGMVLLHLASKNAGASPLKIAGVVLVVGTILSAMCMAYYGLKYWKQGDLDSAHPMMNRMMKMHGMMGPKEMMGPGMMRRKGMMGPGMMGPDRMQGPGSRQPAPEPGEAPGHADDKDEHGH